MALKACQEVLLKVKLQDDQRQHPADVAERGSVTQLISPDAGSIKEEDEEDTDTPSQPDPRPSARPEPFSPPSSSKQSWLLRLFESKLFDVSMAISYLHNSKEPGVQAYIGNRLFSFPHEEVDFYLPQLLNMYIHMDEDVGDAIKPYVVGVARRYGAFVGGW